MRKVCVCDEQRAEKKIDLFGFWLNRQIKADKSLTKEMVAEWLDISTTCLYMKLKGDRRWTLSDVMIICTKLKLTNEEIGELISLENVK